MTNVRKQRAQVPGSSHGSSQAQKTRFRFTSCARSPTRAPSTAAREAQGEAGKWVNRAEMKARGHPDAACRALWAQTRQKRLRRALHSARSFRGNSLGKRSLTRGPDREGLVLITTARVCSLRRHSQRSFMSENPNART